MGGGASSPARVHATLLRSEAEIVRLMMPVYYTELEHYQSLSSTEHELCTRVWTLILDDKAPGFLAARQADPDFPYTTSVTYFYDTFYRRLFDIHPLSRQLFRNGMKSQGRFLVMMISLALSELSDPTKFDKTLARLAENHYKLGVKGVEYGIVGEVLFFTLKVVLGPETYTPEVHVLWLRVYSRMLRTIVPIAISLELCGTQSDKDSMVKRTVQEGCSFDNVKESNKGVLKTQSSVSTAATGITETDKTPSLNLVSVEETSTAE